MKNTCPLCGGRQTTEVFRLFRPPPAAATGRHTEDLFGRAGRLVRCTSCTLVRQADPPSAPYEDAEDPEYLSEERGIRRTFAAILDRIERHRAPPGRLLDIGAGPGLLLEEAVQRGWTATGIEPSTWAAEVALSRGLDVHIGTVEGASLEPTSFDVTVAADVIEHVDDPLEFARRLHALLKPGGVTFVATPNVESAFARLLRRRWWSVIPNHLWYFSPPTLEMLLRKAGFELIERSTHPKTFSIEYYAGRLGGYNRLIGATGRKVAQIFGGRGRLVTPDFRDRLSVIATRTG